MQKQRIVEVEYAAEAIAAPAVRTRPALRPARTRPALRPAHESDVSVAGPARRLQKDLAHAFAADDGWSVKRTVIVGLVFHAVVLGSLVVAAGNLIPHIGR